ncbi:MAG: PIN domain-containing protein [Spirochaetales bacterium]|jgi:tRNA(fMet)-specific endonuclease VapC|nr:PIN domain-containing protein [Spirochaetales bacterium]
MIYMFDTNIISYLIKGSSAALQDRVLEHDPGELAVSALVCAELLYGVKKRGDRVIEKKVHVFLDRIQKIDFDLRAAAAYAGIRTELEKTGMPLDNMDMLIAASALATGAALVTHNVKHFSRIKGLKVEDWS